MFKTDKSYLSLIIAHIVIAIVIYYIPFFSKVYGYGILLYGLYYCLKQRNQDNEVLYVAGYIVGSEVFLRMTNGNPIYEFSKYGVLTFIVIGMYFKGFSKYGTPYWLFLALLIPGIVLATYVLNYETDIRKSISFNISGPLCLGISALYTYQRRITLKQLNDILLAIGLPVITCTVYLMLYTPSIRDVITGTGSNFETSGGFGPNQVSTILGLGMFIFFSRIIFGNASRIVIIVNLIVALNIGYRGLVTFSRGGMITALIMLIILAAITYMKINYRGRVKMNYLLVFFTMALMAIWSYSAFETGGLIEKRYANQDARGRIKKSQFTGRETIVATEIKYFMDNPMFGIGVGKGAELRKSATGMTILSHNEISRMLAEHGFFGILALLILFATPLFLYLDNKDNVYLLCFLLFWLLTINHAAMRLAAPAFVYALSILKVIHEKTPVYRQ